MSKKEQAKLNIGLNEKLMSFVLKHTTILNKYADSSFVVFSDNKKLNKLNEELVLELKNEGRKVVRAEYTKDKSNPWNFSFAL